MFQLPSPVIVLTRASSQCVIALGDSQSGVIVLPTALYLSKTLAKLAIGLDKQPQLIAHLLKDNGGNDPETTETVTLVEKSANVVREAFIKCLTDRTSSPRKPEGKRAGIYLMANLCLTLLFKVRKHWRFMIYSSFSYSYTSFRYSAASFATQSKCSPASAHTRLR